MIDFVWFLFIRSVTWTFKLGNDERMDDCDDVDEEIGPWLMNLLLIVVEMENECLNELLLSLIG